MAEPSAPLSLPLPFFTEERARGGRSPQRATFSDPDVIPQRPADVAKNSRESMQGGLVGPLALPGDNDERDRSTRWEPPDDWRSQWDRNRPPREWYPAYQGPERYDYGAAPRASGVYRSSSLRDQRPPVSYRQVRYSKSAYERPSVEPEPTERLTREPPRDDIDDRYDSEDELVTYVPRRTGGGNGRRGPPRGPLPTDSEPPLRLPWTGWLNTTAKGHFVATVGEFIGTTLFLLFAFAGTQVANVGSRGSANTTTGQSTGFSPNVLMYISLSFGFSLMVNVWVFFRISGGLFNPAVTLAMVLTHAISVSRAILLTGAQLAGAIFSSFLVSVLFPTQFNVRTTLSDGTSLARGVVIEAVLTAELVFTIFMLAKEKHKATFIAPVGIGLALFIAELVGVFYTGGSLNPARSFGPCVVTGIFDQEHWIYWVGPACGAVGAVLFYKFIKMLEYEMANPGQDEEDAEEAAAAQREQKVERIRQAAAASRGEV